MQAIKSIEVDYEQHATTWERSGMNQTAYCLKHQLSYTRLVSARSRLRKLRGKTRGYQHQKSSSFIPAKAQVDVKPAEQHSESLHQPASKPSKIKVHLSSGESIDLPGDVKPELLLAVVRQLQVGV